MHLLDNVIAIVFLSFIFGMIGNAILGKTSLYQRLSERYLLANPKSYERLGVLWYRRILLATPLRYFNTSIRFSAADRNLETLQAVRTNMINAEMSHWIAFAAMLTLNLVVLWYRGTGIAVAYLIFNIIGNLYPSLLQQYNRQRLAKVMRLHSSRNPGVDGAGRSIA